MARPGGKLWQGSDDESSASEDDNRVDFVTEQKKQQKRWEIDTDSDSEDEVRVVRSAKDKAWDEVKEKVGKINNALKINDWTLVEAEFDELNKRIEGKRALFERDGISTPRFYIKLCVVLEDRLAEVKEKAKEGLVKKMSAGNERSFKRMKNKLNKNNKVYENEIADYRASPGADDTEDEESTTSSSEESEAEKPAKNSSSEESSSDDSSSDDTSDSESDSDSSSDDDSSDASSVPAKKKKSKLLGSDSDFSGSESSSSESEDEPGPQLKGRARWVKRAPDMEKDRDKGDKKRVGAVAGEEGVSRRKKKEVSALIAERQTNLLYDQVSLPEFKKKVTEIVSSRGRRGTGSSELLRQLQHLAYVARRFGISEEIPVGMHLILAMFENRRGIDDYMQIPLWRQCASYLQRIIHLLEANPNSVLLSVDGEVLVPGLGHGKGEEAAPQKLMDIDYDADVIKVPGSFGYFVTRLSDEYIKSLQQINPHSQEYVSRLKDEAVLLRLAQGFQAYYTRTAHKAMRPALRRRDLACAAEVAVIRLRFLYYKHDSLAAKVAADRAYFERWGSSLHPACVAGFPAQKDWDSSTVHPASVSGRPEREETPVKFGALVEELAKFVYTHGEARQKMVAILCQISHHALHDRFFEARNLYLMSHIAKEISDLEDEMKILFNRMMVMLGLCAFRRGLMQEAHQCLAEICAKRSKELLAQGVGRAFADRDPAQEKEERRRQMPYHMHINTDLLELCHLTSAMLLEVPNLATLEGRVDKRKTISLYFRRVLQQYETQAFAGPPENIREHLLAAAKALQEGNWALCYEYVTRPDAWRRFPGPGTVDKVKSMLQEKIKTEGLRTYLFTFSPFYDSLSLPALCKMFQMEHSVAHSVISKMIIYGDLHATWDQPTETIVLQRTESSHLQILALQYADRLDRLVMANEGVFHLKTGRSESAGYDEDGRQKGGRFGGRGGGYGSYYSQRGPRMRSGDYHQEGGSTGWNQAGGRKDRGRSRGGRGGRGGYRGGGRGGDHYDGGNYYRPLGY